MCECACMWCVCVCVWQTHWIGTFSPILFTTDESTSFFAYTQRKYCDSFCLRLVKDRNHRGNPRTLFNILISKFILKRQNISSPESLTSDKPMNHSREREGKRGNEIYWVLITCPTLLSILWSLTTILWRRIIQTLQLRKLKFREAQKLAETTSL